jgi:L-iditol 2-dehydrogenase
MPVPGEDEVLVRITGVGLCGSDLHWFENGGIGDTELRRPLVLGHELGGVAESGPLRGRRVALEPAISCGVCALCASDRGNLCPNIRFAGHGRTDGGLRSWMAWPAANLVPVPDEIDDVDVPLLEPLGVALHALRLATVRTGDSVAILGSGPIGLLLVQLARLAGAGVVIATDTLPHRVAAAEALGATALLVPPGDGGADAVAEALGSVAVTGRTGGHGADLTFEAAGVPETIRDAIEVAAPGSRVALVGIPADDRVAFRAAAARRKGLTILLSRRAHETLPRAIELVASRAVRLGSLVTHRFPIGQTAEAFDVLARREGLKVVVEPGGRQD